MFELTSLHVDAWSFKKQDYPPFMKGRKIFSRPELDVQNWKVRIIVTTI